MAILTNINLILQLLLLRLLYTLWNIFHENEQENERNFIIAMSVTELPLIGWSIIKMIFNDLISDGSIRSSLNFHESKVLEIIWVAKRFNTKWIDSFIFSKTALCLAPEKSVGPGETHHSKQRERGRSHLYGEVFVESETLHPTGTTHHLSALGKATSGKSAQAGWGSSISF